MERVSCAAERLTKAREGIRLLIVSIDILQLLHKLAEGCFVQATAILREARANPIPQLLNGSIPFGHSNHRYRQMPPLDHRL